MSSYFTRGALMSEELYFNTHVLHMTCGRLEGELAQEKEAHKWAEKWVVTLEVEVSEVGSKWGAELEKKQLTISNVQTHYAKLSATVNKLREEAAQSERAAEGARRYAEAQKEWVAALEVELEGERQAKLSAQENAGLSQLALQGLKELDASRVAQQAASTNLRAAEDHLVFLTSDEGRKEAIESYRRGPIGKMEVTLAVKAGFDYLKAQLPQDAMPSTGPVYPPRVWGCLDMLLQLEKKGAAIRLEEEKEDGDDEGEEDDDEEDDEEDEGPGDGSGSA